METEFNENESSPIRGVLVPVVTPFRPDLTPDKKLWVGQCKWILSQDCGLAVFGTTSEGNSLTIDERIELLEALADSGIDPARVMPGTGSCSLVDTVRLTTEAVQIGCGGALMLPPFYYKQVTEDGLFAYFSEVISRVGDARLRIYLYHIPPIAVVGFSASLVERLLKEYPGTVVGMKDSSGDWNNTRTMLDNFAADGFHVFVGSETFLLANMRNGGRGCISATANVNPGAIDRLYRHWQDEDADLQQAELDKLRAVFTQFPMIPALKAAIAHYTGIEVWDTLRPPLANLGHAQKEKLTRDLEEVGFEMPGLGTAA